MTNVLSYPDPNTHSHAFSQYITERLLAFPPTRFAAPFIPPRYGALALLISGDASSYQLPLSRDDGSYSSGKKRLSDSLFHAANRWHHELRVAFADELLEAKYADNIDEATSWVQRKLETEMDAMAQAQILVSRRTQDKYIPPNQRPDATESRACWDGRGAKALADTQPPTRGPFSPVNGQFQHQTMVMDRRHSVDHGKKDPFANFKSKRQTMHAPHRSWSYV